MESLETVDIAAIGTPVKEIHVEFRYKIIDLFSGHLYSAPTKAIEELVVNSFDAFATKCVVSVLDSVEKPVWVWDNGESMDVSGLEELWLIAESKKRERQEEYEKRGRLPVGKFGIGKLASYVVGKRITHLCRRDTKFLAVTMDYARINDEPEELPLSIRELSEQDVRKAIPFIVDAPFDSSKIDLFGEGSTTWTIVVIDQLKQLLQIGRLHWILSTALPLTPDFELFLNGSSVQPSKIQIKKLNEWQIGKDDRAAKDYGFETGQDTASPPYDYFVKIAEYGKISGNVELYADPLNTGKASELGHSNGFFVMVRERLLNVKDNSFGITSLPHLGFNRFRAVVRANFLDDYLTANREDITNADAREALKKYLIAKFNEVRNFYEASLEKQAKKESLEDHLSTVPGTLLSYPLRHALDEVKETNASPFMIRTVPDKPSPPTIEKIETRSFDTGAPLASLEAGVVFINVSHPFYAAFQDFPGIRKIAIAEILLEAYLLDAGVDSEKTLEILSRRDQLLRFLASRLPEGAVEIAKFIRDSVNSSDDLEVACVDGFRVLGFDAVRIGGSGKPDGLASAYLGVSTKGEKRSYSLTFDAKSTQEKSVQTGNLGLATVVKHKSDYQADFAVVIAPNYQIGDGENSNVVKEARQQNVCLITAGDFADLIVASAVKPLSLETLGELFEIYSPIDTASWIDTFKKEKISAPPIPTILETVWKIQQVDQTDAPEIGAIKWAELGLQKFSNREIKQWLISVSRLVPELVSITGEKVQLNQTPGNILLQIKEVLKQVPATIITEPIEEGLE